LFQERRRSSEECKRGLHPIAAGDRGFAGGGAQGCDENGRFRLEPAGPRLVVTVDRARYCDIGPTPLLDMEIRRNTAMAVKTVQDLLVDELRDIYHAEKQLVKALPKMAKAVKSDKLRQAFEQHLEETKGQVERLETVFDKLDTPARAKRCEAMAGLIEEAQETMDEVKTPEVLDAALIAAAQKVEHYEIASYGSARALAEALGNQDAAQLLDQTLEEEKSTDQKLNQIALSDVNKSALNAAA
jgi:ferritin-like metal-binding protein YciE